MCASCWGGWCLFLIKSRVGGGEDGNRGRNINTGRNAVSPSWISVINPVGWVTDFKISENHYICTKDNRCTRRLTWIICWHNCEHKGSSFLLLPSLWLFSVSVVTCVGGLLKFVFCQQWHVSEVEHVSVSHHDMCKNTSWKKVWIDFSSWC